MKILVIDEWIPYPLDSGKKIRTFSLLAPLAGRHEITYLCYADPVLEADRIAKLEQAGFRVVCVPPVNKYSTPMKLAAGVATNFFSRMPLAVRKHYSHHYQQAVLELTRNNDFDLVHCEWTHYGAFLDCIDDLPKFLCSHNIECLHWYRFSKTQKNPIRKAGIYLEWLKMRSFEQRICSIFDHVSAVSDAEAKAFRAQFGVKSVDVVPNGVSIPYYRENGRKPEKDLLVFSASMDTFINQDAAHYFVQEIFPRIRERRPDIRLMILGRNPPQSISNLANHHIIVTGTVDDVRPYLGRALVSVVPLRIAAGSRLKILESFAAGIPVVSTTFGAEGLEVIPGEHLLIADDENAFAKDCIRLLDDPLLRNNLAAAGKTLVSEKYEWTAISPGVEQAWETTIRNFRNRKKSDHNLSVRP